MTLHVERLHARFASAQALPPAQVRGWLGLFAAQDDEALAAAAGASAAERGDEAWLLVRRLPLQLQWRADAPDADIAPLWAQGLHGALRLALDDAAPDNVLRYARREDAWADLLYQSALGRTQRQWAWRHMELLTNDQLPAEAALQEGWQALANEPAAVWPVLARLIAAEPDCAALSALLRAIDPAGWRALLGASLRTAPYLAKTPLPPTPSIGPTRPQSAAAPPHAMAALLAWARARPDLLTRRGEAVFALLAAQAWPGPAPSLAAGARRAQAVRDWLGDAVGPPVAVLLRDQASADRSMAEPAVTAPAAPPDAIDTVAPLPTLPQPEADTQPTDWAGALFWLARVPFSGLIAKPGAPVPAVPATLLLALARALGVPDDDAACAALCGGRLPEAPVSDDEADRAQAQAQLWAEWLDAEAPELPTPRLQHVCRRRGRLRLWPGWTELVLPLDGVDVSVRRLGLDLSPGWLPWWGSVLSIRYEDPSESTDGARAPHPGGPPASTVPTGRAGSA